MKKHISFLIIFFISVSYHSQSGLQINTSHLDYLFEEITIDGIDMGIIHIYSNYPDYKYVGDEDEGIACVDDAARAAAFYLMMNDDENLRRNKMLLEFILHMQAENGYFYNFIWPDYSINKEFKTSVAEPNWWSWRALWTLTISYEKYQNEQDNFSEKIRSGIENIISAIKIDIPSELKTERINGMEIPTWLPHNYASDQASLLLLSLLKYYEINQDEEIKNYINILSEGIMGMQVSEQEEFINGAILSWRTDWHAWGNLQSFALLKSFQITNDSLALKTALYELDTFYEYLIKNNFLNSFSVIKENENIIIKNEKKFPQIAYNIRPMVYALIEAYKITNEERYAQMAGRSAAWLTGNNPAEAQIYFPKTGIVYDGIESENFLNKNSGAESTIEALLILYKINSSKIAVNTFLDF